VDLDDAVSVGACAPVPELHEGARHPRAAITVDDGDDERGGPISKRRSRRCAMEAERGPERVRRRLVPTAAGGGEAGQEKQQDP